MSRELDQDELDKKLKKIQKKIGKEKMEDMDRMSEEQLKAEIVGAQKRMYDSESEMKSNNNYVQAKNTKSAFEGGLRDVKKINNAQIEYALHRLEEKGKM